MIPAMPGRFAASSLLFLLPAVASAQPAIKNGDFEEKIQGTLPPGWFGGSAAYPVSIVRENCKSGKQCALVRSAATPAPNGFGLLGQSINATPYLGKTVRFRAAVRAEVSGPGNQTQLLLTTHFPDSPVATPITSSAWKFYEATIEIPSNARNIHVGLIFKGSGSAWLDDASLEIPEPPRPLSARGLENVLALARLFGYVRYFDPSDAAAATDWDTLAIQAVRDVESAQNPTELASRLAAVFGSAPPTVQVFPTSAPQPALRFDPAANVIEWRHYGVGLSEGTPYHSERVTRPAAGPALREPFRADLSGGVTCLVPMTIYTNKQGVFNQEAVTRKTTGTPDDRATRLAAVIIAWNVLQHFYPYFDVVRTDWPKALSTALASAATDRSGTEFLTTLRRMIASLHDGHGRVTWNESKAVPSPVGWDWVEGRLVITDVPDPGNQPIHRGDVVIAINGKPVKEVLAAAESGISAATPQWLLARALGTGLHYGEPLGAIGEGPEDEPLTLELEPFENPQARRTVTLDRRVSRKPVREARPAAIAEIKPNILYLDLSRITEEDWSAWLLRLERASGLIFDLRGYPSGGFASSVLSHLSETPLKSAQWHVPIVTAPDRQGMKFDRSGEWSLPPEKPYLRAKKVFLTDGRAISYSETLMSIVEQYRLGEIVGGPTAGTNGNINPFTVPGGYRTIWTGMKVLKHDGSQHHGIGISPTVPVSRTLAGVAAGRDEVLERALDLLR
jgi:C-terminal processing protease CtpA/Prc